VLCQAAVSESFLSVTVTSSLEFVDQELPISSAYLYKIRACSQAAPRVSMIQGIMILQQSDSPAKRTLQTSYRVVIKVCGRRYLYHGLGGRLTANLTDLGKRHAGRQVVRRSKKTPNSASCA
jgi:hypothetical protein